MTIAKTRLKLLEETRQLYYGSNWRPLTTRSVSRGGKCMYTNDENHHCAMGRLAPDALWYEGVSLVASTFAGKENQRIALVAAIKYGVHSGDDGETLAWMVELQRLHDRPMLAEHQYQAMKEKLASDDYDLVVHE